MRRQAGRDMSAQVVADLTTLKDSHRQLDLFEHIVVPARQAVDIGRSSYETGHASLLDPLDSQRLWLAIERLVVNLKANREKHLYDLETITYIGISDKPLKQTIVQAH